MKKWIKRIVILLVVVVVAAIVGVVLFVDQAAKAGIEAGGSSALGVKTQVDKVSVGLLSSSVTIKQLRIGNPEGYKTDHLLTLGRGKLACSVRSFFGNEPHIREITLEQPELTIELRYKNLVPKSNIGDLISSLDSGKKARQEAPKEKAPEGQKTFRIDHIRIVGTKVRFHLLAGKTADVTLPDIELKELKNRDGTPLLLADIFRQVLSSMSVSAFKKAKGIVPDDLLKGFGTTLGSARQLIQGLGSRVTERVGKLGKEATGLIGDAGKEIGK
ncbi:AsmA family protein, partial [bacterium]|nr:AsmA family protein [bacterium]